MVPHPLGKAGKGQGRFADWKGRAGKEKTGNLVPGLDLLDENGDLPVGRRLGGKSRSAFGREGRRRNGGRYQKQNGEEEKPDPRSPNLLQGSRGRKGFKHRAVTAVLLPRKEEKRVPESIRRYSTLGHPREKSPEG